MKYLKVKDVLDYPVQDIKGGNIEIIDINTKNIYNSSTIKNDTVHTRTYTDDKVLELDVLEIEIVQSTLKLYVDLGDTVLLYDLITDIFWWAKR